MISDKLYEQAFAYKKTKLWHSMWDTEIFAVNLSGGRIGYVSIMGASGEHCALGLYIGQKGFHGIRLLLEAANFPLSPFSFHENMTRQECLQCSFERKDELSEEELKEAKNYARAHGIKLAGKNAYPQFMKYTPNHIPQPLQTEQDQQDLSEALRAATALAKLTEGKLPGDLGLFEEQGSDGTFPLLELKNGVYTLGRTPIPDPPKTEYPAPEIRNDIAVAKLKRCKRFGIWECEIIRFPKPVRNHKDEVPFYPVILLAVEHSSYYSLSVNPVPDYEENPEVLLNFFTDSLLEENIFPAEIRVRDERTYAFAESFCKKTGIKLNMNPDLPALEYAEEDLWENMGPESENDNDISDMLDALSHLEEDQLQDIPSELLDQLKILSDEDTLPDDMKIRLKRLLRKISSSGQRALPSEDQKTQKSGRKKGAPGIRKAGITSIAPEQTYVISVSLGSGCYRHIRISGSNTLLDLHLAIQEAFQFDDDHPHAFFMDNRVWSNRDCYFAKGMDYRDRTTGDCKLNQAGLTVGKQFKYLFDFGDEWTFQCKVLRITDGGTDAPSVIRSVGNPPSQYNYEPDEDGEF